ncbi:NTE family protein [Aquimarina sp. MAR_2010_214]|uniref:patatin-like phospholipase family protein n=1 Tax=Aquimarina sp. MAR_2010_214 TaxID=1250026 RepID=UPI000C713FB3|nr:patatin-like phospholipase family protein [Aquimarina sp. MAR_2010_214]PKV51296.1 NTE family protein [Aquimarina sp. MAR_2010_214]
MNIQERIIKGFSTTSRLSIYSEENIKRTTRFFTTANEILEKSINDPQGKLKDKFTTNGLIKKELISEATINEVYAGESIERPVVDLVQQGGGMYGIALLGYTYIMEKVGIRFYSHGGTSAGAINALFLASIPNSIYTEDSKFQYGNKSHQATKSEILTHIIANTDFSKFMEKNGIIGWLQQKLLRNYKSIILKLFLSVFCIGFLVGIYGLFSIIFNITNGVSGTELRLFDFIIGTLNVVALLIFIYILLVKILDTDFGINTGEKFYSWAENLLSSIQIETNNDLTKKMNQVELTKTKSENTSRLRPIGDKPRLVLITSNLTHNRIVKFPERADDYWTTPGNIKPAAFLRATMSIPFIYKNFTPGTKHYKNEKNTGNSVKLNARFVDGGMLSNFPIREFHRKDNIVPRFPTFGVLLSERVVGNQKENKDSSWKTKKLENITLIGYITSFISTFRNFYDNDFLFNNKEIEKRVVTVDTKDHNWLDFWMDDTEKAKLFNKGVDAAIRQIEQFDWITYKDIREEKIKNLN